MFVKQHGLTILVFLPVDVISATGTEVAALGQEVISDKIFNWVTDAETNKPYLKGSGRDAFGRWTGQLVTGEGWRQLQHFGLTKGFVATGYDTPFGPFSRPLQFLRIHLWEPSCANVTCPSAMQDGAARLMQLHLFSKRASKLSSEQRRVFESAYQHLISRDPSLAWTSGQWMTERTGGSDVSQTETTAVYKPNEAQGLASKEEGTPLGPWSINGFKWFSSATDSNMTVLLARTPAGGLSTFLAPMYKHDPDAVTATGLSKADASCLNGVRISRLKDKVGTRPLPTAELVLEDMRGWMIGDEGRGIHEISTVLTITRVHSAVAAAGCVGRSLDIAKAFARVREIGVGKGGRIRLTDSPLHMRTLSRMTAEYRGLMLLTIFTSYVLGLSEHPTESMPGKAAALRAITPSLKHTAALLRVLTQITKAYVCKNSVSLIFSCMESMGGVGYLNNADTESINISRLWRDCAVLPIWEGTTDVNSTDFIRAVKHLKGGQDSLDALEDFIRTASVFNEQTPRTAEWNPIKVWNDLRTRIASTSQSDLMGDARDILWDVAHILISLLLQVDAYSDGNLVAHDIFERFIEDKFAQMPRNKGYSTREKLERDLAIVYGDDSTNSGVAAKL